jgi:hypothetical protein
VTDELAKPTRDYTGAQIRAIIVAVGTKQPTPDALQAYRHLLADRPHAWRIAGDMAAIAERLMLKEYEANVAMHEALAVGLATLRQDLGAATAPALERLLIEQVVLCWLQMYDAQYRYTTAHAESMTLTKADYWERRLSQVQGRYLRATEALARVRRLGQRAALQVNIGAQQLIA